VSKTRAEKERAAEILLEAKGFDGSIVYIVDDQVDVVVNAANLTDQQLAIIEEVVKSKTDIPVDKIYINPVVVED
jgi:stage III sporulation protein AH